MIARTEGFSAFYKSYFTQVSMNIPYQSTHLVTYDYIQKIINPRREYNPISHSISGAIAGAFAAAVTTPLDVCKTLINTQECCNQSKSCPIRSAMLQEIFIKNNLPERANNLSAAVKIVYHTEGLRGFFKGLVPRTVFQIPGTAVSWSVYEFFKYYLNTKLKNQNKYEDLKI